LKRVQITVAIPRTTYTQKLPHSQHADGSFNEENAMQQFKNFITDHKIQYSDEELKADVEVCTKKGTCEDLCNQSVP
jgi:hypothetical protein